METAHTIDELIKFKMECKNRVYDVIYNSRGQKTVVGPAYVDEEQIIKLSIREKARIYIPGRPEPLQVIGEIATANLRIGASTFTIETALHRERNTPVVLGKEFGRKFIVSVNTEHKILTLKDDNGIPCAITYELYSETWLHKDFAFSFKIESNPKKDILHIYFLFHQFQIKTSNIYNAARSKDEKPLPSHETWRHSSHKIHEIAIMIVEKFKLRYDVREKPS